MTPGRIVEPLDVVEHIRSGLVSCPICFAAGTLSVFSDEKKLSIAALSQTLPDRLMLQTMPLSAISRWSCSLEYWAALIGVAQ
jgi:hypothetical protein